MSNDITLFEQIRRTNPAGTELWSGRDRAGWLPLHPPASLSPTPRRDAIDLHRIRNNPITVRCMNSPQLHHRITIASPDLLAIIKQEGKV